MAPPRMMITRLRWPRTTDSSPRRMRFISHRQPTVSPASFGGDLPRSRVIPCMPTVFQRSGHYTIGQYRLRAPLLWEVGMSFHKTLSGVILTETSTEQQWSEVGCSMDRFLCFVSTFVKSNTTFTSVTWRAAREASGGCQMSFA